MAVVKWVFTDSVVPETYTFEVNPNEGGSPTRKKNITGQPTTAEDGTAVLYEGQDPRPTTTFSGTILTEAQYDAMIAWFNKRYPITVDDDLGRTMTIYITGFDPKRAQRRSHPWRHTYTVDVVILAES